MLTSLLPSLGPISTARLWTVSNQTSNARSLRYLLFSQHKAPADEHEVRVIVLNGHDEEFARAATHATLLDQSIVLAFFAPSKEVLDTLQTATKCLLYIPSVKLEDGTPLVVHRRPDGVLNVTPGFSMLTESSIHVHASVEGEISGEAALDSNPPSLTTPPATPDEKLVMNFAKSVEIIQLTVEYHLELLHGVRPMAEEDRLTPPGTNFYKTCLISRTTPGQTPPPLFIGDVPVTDQRFNHVSRLRLHAYCTGAKPTDPNFSQNGGRVHVFAVLSGQAGRDFNYYPRQSFKSPQHSYIYWFLDTAAYEIYPRTLIGERVEPQRADTNGFVTHYYTNFTTTLHLWTNGGDNTFEFQARYLNDFTRTEFKQKVLSQPPGHYRATFYYDNYYDASLRREQQDWQNVFDDEDAIKPFPTEADTPLHVFFAWSTSSLSLERIDIVSRILFAGFQHRETRRAWNDGLTASSVTNHDLDLTPSSWE